MNYIFDYRGKIKPKERPRMGKWGVFTPRSTVKSENDLVLQFKRIYKDVVPSENPIKLVFNLTIKPPKSWNKIKTKMALDGLLLPTAKPDIDNILKTILDAFNGVIYKDDSQVVEIMIKKEYGIADGALIQFYEGF